MPAELLTRPPAPHSSPLRVLPIALCLALGLGVGFAAARLFPADRHTAEAETLTGTVTWSNAQTQLIAFETDGVKRGRNDGDTIYSVVPNNWQDKGGTFHSDEVDYPPCLAGEKDDPVSTDRHRVRLEVVHVDTGSRKPDNVAIHVQCLD